MTRVVAPSRLHFGLMSLPEGGSARRFGGVGLMIDAPGVVVRAEPSERWEGDGRALAFAKRVTDAPHRVEVERCPPEHVGLGVGTQLGMAVARAILDAPAEELARRVGRGLRSAIGVRGFECGGFVLDAGKQSDDELSPVLPTPAYPAGWGAVVVVPRGVGDWHGRRESDAFAGLTMPRAWTDRLAGVVLLAMLPALAAADFDHFGEAVYQYNRAAGEAFEVAQGGIYASPAVAEVIAFWRRLGVNGVGQSSWGPTVFALTESPDHGRWLAERYVGSASEVVVAEVSGGAVVRNARPNAATENTNG